jgi:hypothetical protein
MGMVQFNCHPEPAFLCAVKDLGEPRDVSRSLRHNNRAFGSLPYQIAPQPDYVSCQEIHNDFFIPRETCQRRPARQPSQ